MPLQIRSGKEQILGGHLNLASDPVVTDGCSDKQHRAGTVDLRTDNGH